jgi:hypothetical protein
MPLNETYRLEGERKRTMGGEYSAVSFRYDETNSAVQTTENEEASELAFKPSFSVPEGVQLVRISFQERESAANSLFALAQDETAC